ncbi:MAG: hypothetical protein NTX46_01100 [Chloroflexi bacterium]|nr:hypothetical protein [Chloroflexota bacterium]
MKKETIPENTRISEGRPRVTVDYAILLRLREAEHFGWSQMAKAYRKMTGQFVSRDTLKRRYLEIKARESAGKLVINSHKSSPKKSDEPRGIVKYGMMITPCASPKSMKQ